MKVAIEREELRFATNLIENVANSYRKVLNNSMIFTAKLLTLDVFVNNSPIGKTAGLVKVIEKYTCKCAMRLLINPNDGDEYISFVIAHEFAHLLMINPNDMLKIAGRAEDGSTAYTAIKRITANNEVYGRAFEEAVADRLAMYIISKLYGNVGIEKVRTLLGDNECKRLEYIENFANVFGKPLEECEKIDEFVLNENNGNISNIFWYKIVTFDFGSIIDAYNSAIADVEKNFYILDSAFENFFTNEDKRTENTINSWIQEFIEKAS